jgi:CRISPR-associated protein Csx14
MQGRMVEEIHIITTKVGYEHLLKFIAPSGSLEQFLKEYNIPQDSIKFPVENIHVVKDEFGSDVDDIIDESTNFKLIELCLEVTFKLTKNPEHIVYFLVAGGRKTMSSCLSLAVQLYGRPQDRMYHVLVSSEFESNRDFWFPPKKSKLITLYDEKGQPYKKETKYAKIELVSIPFVSVRKWLKEELLKEPLPPQELISHLVIDSLL